MDITSNLSPNMKSIGIEGKNQSKIRIAEENIPIIKKKNTTFFFFNLSPPFYVINLV